MKTYSLNEIKSALEGVDLIHLIEKGFIAYSEGRSVVPPVGELVFKDPPGDVHIKYGYIKGDDYYCIKIASGFHCNEDLGIPGGSGMMLLFRQKTGESVCVLHDEAYLTDVRTAVAGAIAARYLAPKEVSAIGVIGTGRQARMQVEYLEGVVDCKDVAVWGRTLEKVDRYQNDMITKGYAVTVCDSPSEVAERSNLIITATNATEPLLSADDIPSGRHFTAMGSDTHEKRELEGGILARADLLVADSIPQCIERGEIAWCLREGVISEQDIVELGNVINGKSPGRDSENQITVADLTGVAVQDIQIATAVYTALENETVEGE
ncbi:MAG: ornithine cyclodeaminase family protein [Candidatus Marinimicrobia bacterium]|nr:ornithine cyclodeaminase family protein [Candidatus Neomarinimicrobiota bacterium]